MTFLQNYRAAVYLNNAGVTLVKGRCYSEARDVLKYAASAIRLAIMGSGLDPHNMIIQADQFVATRINIMPQGPISVEVICDNHFDAASHLLLTNIHSLPGGSVNPIRIESAAFSHDTVTETDIRVLSSVTMYNLAITYNMLAMTGSSLSPSAAITLNMFAYRFFHFSYSTSLTICNSEHESAILSKVAALAAFTLKHLVYVCIAIGADEAQTKEYGRRLAEYQAYVVAREKKLLSHVLSSPAA